MDGVVVAKELLAVAKELTAGRPLRKFFTGTGGSFSLNWWYDTGRDEDVGVGELVSASRQTLAEAKVDVARVNSSAFGARYKLGLEGVGVFDEKVGYMTWALGEHSTGDQSEFVRFLESMGFVDQR